MKVDWAEVFKVIAKASWIISSRTLAYLVPAALMSGLMFLFIFPELKTLWIPMDAANLHLPEAAIFAVTLHLILNWKAILLGAVFLAVFPVVFLLWAKKYAIGKAISYIYSVNKKFLIAYITKKLFEFAEKSQKWVELLEEKGTFEALGEVVAIFIRKLEGVPFLLRGMFRYLLKKIDLFGIIKQVMEEEKVNKPDMEVVAQKVAEKAEKYLDDLTQPTTTHFWILLVFEVTAFICVKIFI